MSAAISCFGYEKLVYTRDHVLTKLIRDGTDADAASTLLFYSYGQRFIDDKPGYIEDIERLAGKLKALRTEWAQHPERRGELQSQIAAAEAAIIDGLKQCSPHELRDHDVPALLAYRLYREGKYQQAAWCLDIIVRDYPDIGMPGMPGMPGGGILAIADVASMETVEEFTYSYTTPEEQAYLERILELDKEIGVLREYESTLRQMPHTPIITYAAEQKALAGSFDEDEPGPEPPDGSPAA